MATQTSTIARTVPTGVAASGMSVAARAAASLWWREIVRFYRNRARVLGVILSPIVFWLLLGLGFGTSLRVGDAGSQHYLDYFFPGALIMIVLFTSIFTMMSVIEDRKEGFLLTVLVAPVGRSVIVLGKVLGGATLAAAQGLVFLLAAPFLHVQLTLVRLLLAIVVVTLVSFALTALGFAIAWPMDSTAAFHGIVNLFMIPLWLLSGALFPIAGASRWVRAAMLANPLTYGIESLRGLLYPGSAEQFSVGTSIAVLATFSAVLFAAGFVLANRRTTKPAA
jgi:ABC-2 type transport system permease protein